MAENGIRSVTLRVDYGNRSEAWWQALWQRLETEPGKVPAALRRLVHPRGGDAVEVPLAEARAALDWAAALPGWAGGPRHAPNPLRLEPGR
jgi:hypothetical protein